MHRLEMPAITSGLIGAAVEGLVNLPSVSGFKDALPGKIGDILGATGLGRTALKGLIDSVVSQIENELKGAIGNGAANFDPSLQSLGVTPFH